MRRLCRQNCLFNWIGPSAVAMTCASSTTPRYPRKVGVAAQYASRWARPRTARPWYTGHAGVKCTLPICGSSGRLPDPAVPVRSMLLTFYRYRLKTLLASAKWRIINWRTGTKESSRLVRCLAAGRPRTITAHQGRRPAPTREAWLTCIHVRLGDFLWGLVGRLGVGIFERYKPGVG